ncbi:hypothetical protein ASG67_08205 [Sphingomonas sp. Leaf339]|uniref:hypothetical protein n=1 Tax=Sphingomonas sp. Leaf339 TaxID=1736343 RepID=UPI0007157465|nr:hypothetical protein [Sphingomonas sp. Leaf339]KQU56040.1 hypothetical protein ASG67_08205 [Sphingomonas sp. Leaf339]
MRNWRRAWIAYFIAHTGKSLLWTASDLLTLYLLVSVYAVDPIVAGALFLAGLAANATADLAVGIWLGRHPHHAARLAGVALALSATSFPATVLMAPHGPWVLLAATLIFRITYAGCDVPHNALLTRLGSDPARATWLARGRTIGTALASLLAAWGANSGANAIAPPLYSIAFAALVVGSAMVPLLAAFPLDPERHRRARSVGLPLPFLAASVIGIVALGALAKAALHLPTLTAPASGATILALVIAGRTLSALIPIRIGSIRSGLLILAGAYGAAATLAAGFAFGSPSAMLVLLGFALGTTNLIGWALLPALADGPRGYGLYTMASKLALGTAGLALAGGLGRVPAFTSDGFATFTWMVAVSCLVAALLAGLRLTSLAARGFPSS